MKSKRHNRLTSIIYHLPSNNSAFTLMELLIVIALLCLLAAALLALLNPWAQISKANDAKRKSDLAQLKKTFEDYYNDKECYPKPEEVCIDGGAICTICGSDPKSPANFNPYMSKLPCDPNYSQRKYMYSVDETSCPSSFRIYVNLANNSDKAIAEVGCTGAICGPYGDSNYGVSSPNVDLERNGTIVPTPTASITGPAPTSIPICNPNAMYKRDAGGACNSYTCQGLQVACSCTNEDPCFSNYPLCNVRCNLQ